MKLILTRSSGVTVAELMVVITVLGVLTGLVFGPLNDIYTDNSNGLRTVIQTSDARAALRTIERDVTLSSKFMSQNDIIDVPNNTPVGGNGLWAWTGTPVNTTSNRVLIVQAYGTTSLATDDDAGSRDIVIKDPTCNTTRTPITIDYVYFVYNKNLYRRTVKSTVTSDTGCNGKVVQKRSCASGVSNPNCVNQAADSLITSNVSYFSVDYYVKASDPSAISNQYSSASSLDSATSIVITLTTTTGNGSSKQDATARMRITRINGTL